MISVSKYHKARYYGHIMRQDETSLARRAATGRYIPKLVPGTTDTSEWLYDELHYGEIDRNEDEEQGVLDEVET